MGVVVAAVGDKSQRTAAKPAAAAACLRYRRPAD